LFFVFSSVPLSVKVTPSHLNTESGRSIVLNCSASGHPSPSLHWLHNGEPIVSTSRPKYTSLNAASNGGQIKDQRLSVQDQLRLDQLTRKDRGVYQCVAKNEFQEVHGAMQLTLKGTSNNFTS
jgi:hypothetical protein